MRGKAATAPDPERIVGIARTARAWLASVPERLPAVGDAAVRALCHVLIASWLADTIVGRDRAGTAVFPEVAGQVASALSSAGNRDHLGGVNPALKLLAEILLSSEGQEVEPLRRFFAQSVTILRQPDPAMQADPSLMDKRILLHSTGVLPPPLAASPGGLRVLLDGFRLSASADLIEALTLHLECLTGWGTRSADDGLITPPLGGILAGLTVQHLRNYNLVPAARLLRLHEYLAASNLMPRRDDLYRDLCLHHRAHGPFGWYGPEAAKLCTLSPALRADLEFHLPATVECLWALAERSLPGWRLFGQVPPYAPKLEEGLVTNAR